MFDAFPRVCVDVAGWEDLVGWSDKFCKTLLSVFGEERALTDLKYAHSLWQVRPFPCLLSCASESRTPTFCCVLVLPTSMHTPRAHTRF